MLWHIDKGKATEPVVTHRNYFFLLGFLLAPAAAPAPAPAAALPALPALPALLSKEQLARHKKVTNDCEGLLVFLLEFLRLRFSRMTSFASNKAFFEAASAWITMVTISYAQLRRKQHTFEHERTFHGLWLPDTTTTCWATVSYDEIRQEALGTDHPDGRHQQKCKTQSIPSPQHIWYKLYQSQSRMVTTKEGKYQPESLAEPLICINIASSRCGRPQQDVSVGISS